MAATQVSGHPAAPSSGSPASGAGRGRAAAADPAKFAASTQLARDKLAFSRFQLADAVFRPSGAPEGWTRLDDAHLQALHLDPQQFHPAASQFRAALFQGPSGESVLAFKGTTVTSVEDWQNNAEQAFGLKSDYYGRAISLAQQVKTATGGRVELTGQSLGGGLATAAGLATHSRATIFNAAGVSGATLAPFHVSAAEASRPMADGRPLIEGYDVQGEILDGAQRAAPAILGPLAPLLGATGHEPQPAAGVIHTIEDAHPQPAPQGLVNTLLDVPHRLAHEAVEHERDSMRDALLAQIGKDERTVAKP